MFYSDYAQDTLRALLDMNNVDNYTFVGHIFNASDIIDFCYLMPYDNGEFYIKKVLCFNEEVDLFDCFKKVKNHMKLLTLIHFIILMIRLVVQVILQH